MKGTCAILLCFAISAALGAHAQAAPAAIPAFQHVFVLVEENETYDKVIGNTADMPFLNSLASTYGLATNYFADTHPSINNYFYLTSGKKGTSFLFYGMTADLYPFGVDGPNIASILTKYGKTWKSYAESLPRGGYIGGNEDGYAKRHDPFAYYESVRNNKDQRKNIVPFKQLEKDLKDNKLPDFGFIVPNIYDDAHNDPPEGEIGIAPCGDHAALQHADKWLKDKIGPLINSPAFQDSLLIITFDEACATGHDGDWRFSPGDRRRDGGGHVPTILVSTRIAPGTQSGEVYHHESVLRTVLEALGIDEVPGRASHARDMRAFFTQKRAASGR